MSSSSSSSLPPPHPSSDPSSLPDEQLTLALRLATHPVHPSPSTHVFSCSRDLTILGLKERLYKEWDGQPKPDGITLIKGGRVCRDTESVKEVFEDELKNTPQPELVLHVVVRASAWSAPFTSPPPPQLAPPSVPSPSLPSINTIPPSAFPSPPKEGTETEVPPPPTTTTKPDSNGYSPSYITSPLPSTSTTTDEPSATTTPQQPGSANPYLTYLSHLQRLIPIQRSLLLLNLQKAHHYYQLQVQVRRSRIGGNEQAEAAEEAEKELAEVESLLKECGLWNLVRQHEEGIEERYNKENVEVSESKKKEEGEFKVVHLDGLPYLLHTPPSLQQRRRPSLESLKSLSRAESILKILTTMLQLLIVFQPTSPSIAHGRALSGYRPTVVNATLNPVVAGAAGRGDELAILQAAAGIRPPPPGPQGQVDPFAPLLQQPPPHHQHHQHRAIRRAATISITLHLDSLLQFLLPLFFLSLKLAFLLFVFARHASPFKRNVLIAGAVLWVVWEGIRIGRRGRRPADRGGGVGADRGGRGGDRNDRDRERRRAAREEARARWHQDQQDAQMRAANRAIAEEEEAAQARFGGRGLGQEIDRNPGVIGDPPLRQRNVPQGQPQIVARQQPHPPTPAVPPRSSSSSSSATRREPPSVFSPKYWINSLAAVGLVEEARELGLSPRYIAGRPISAANRMPYVPLSQLSRWERQKSEARRLGRIVWTGIVLFVGTLIPEVERKRKKALEKRERLLLEKKVRWEREKESERNNNGASRSKRRVEEKSKEEEQHEVEKRATITKGREKISDEELFRDGGSEAFTSSSPNATASTSTAGSHQASSSTAATSQAQTRGPPVPTSAGELSPPSPLVPSTPITPTETDLEDEEGDGDIAASASVSENNSDDELAPDGARGGGQDGRGAQGDEQDGAVVAIF